LRGGRGNVSSAFESLAEADGELQGGLRQRIYSQRNPQRQRITIFLNTQVKIALAEQLRRCAKITHYDAPGHDEAGQLAHGFADLEDEAHRLLDALPKLVTSEDCATTVDQLLAIGETLRQILRQIRAARFYDYLPTDDEMRT
jgi:hypothetical protein